MKSHEFPVRQEFSQFLFSLHKHRRSLTDTARERIERRRVGTSKKEDRGWAEHGSQSVSTPCWFCITL